MRRQAGQRGVTLLEMLVALFIFALAAGSLVKVLGQQGRYAAELESRHLASLAAQNHLVSLHLQPQWPALGRRQHEATLGGRTLLVREAVVTTDSEWIRRVSLEVSTQEQPERVLSRLEAFMGPSP